MIRWSARSTLAAFAAALAAPTAASEARAQSVTPFVCAITQVTTGGTAVTPISGRVNGAIIWNLAGSTTSPLYVNQTGTATTTEGAGNYPLIASASAPSQPWLVIPSSTLPVSVNSTDGSHKFGCLQW